MASFAQAAQHFRGDRIMRGAQTVCAVTAETTAKALGGRKTGGGPLRRVLEAAVSEARCSAKALTVLATQNDPYQADTQCYGGSADQS